LSQSKMPPQQRQRAPNLVGRRFYFRPHGPDPFTKSGAT
jgi:hypothetical protein